MLTNETQIVEPLGGSLRERFARGAFWGLAGAVVGRVSVLAAAIIAARLLGKRCFGELGMIQSTVGMFGVFAGFGLGLTNTKHVAELWRTDPDRAGRIMGMTLWVALVTGALTALGLVLVAPWLASHVINAPHLVDHIRIAGLFLFILALKGTQTGSLAGFEAFREIACVNLIQGIAALPVTVLLVLRWGLRGAVWAMVCVAAMGWLANHLFLRKKCGDLNVHVSYRAVWRERAVLWGFSLPALLGQAVVGPAVWAANAMLANQPNGYAELGIFNAAYQWRAPLLFIPAVLGQSLMPILSSTYGSRDQRSLRKVLLAAIALALAAAVPLVVVLVLLRKPVMSMCGAQFVVGSDVLVLVVLGAALVAIQTPVGQVIAASGRMWLGAGMNCGWALILVVSLLFLRGRGAKGLALAFLIAYLIHSIWVFIYGFLTVKKSDSTGAGVSLRTGLERE